jgi:tetratricopeptide (TPR) repeat protein
VQGDRATAAALRTTALPLARALGRIEDVIDVLQDLAMGAVSSGEIDGAATLIEEALALQHGTPTLAPNPLLARTLGKVAYHRGQFDRAAAAYEDALVGHRAAGDRQWIADVLDYLGDVEVDRGNLTAALQRYREALALWQELKDGWGTADALVGFVDVAAANTQPQRAARLLGAAEVLYERAGIGLPPHDRPTYGRAREATRRQLGDEAFATLRAEGRAMPIEAVIDEALKLKEQGDMTEGALGLQDEVSTP